MNLIALHLNYCIELFYIDKKFNYSKTDLQYFYSPCEKSKTVSFVSSIMKKVSPWKFGLTKWFKYCFFAYVFGSDLYLFQLIVLLK